MQKRGSKSTDSDPTLTMKIGVGSKSKAIMSMHAEFVENDMLVPCGHGAGNKVTYFKSKIGKNPGLKRLLQRYRKFDVFILTTNARVTLEFCHLNGMRHGPSPEPPHPESSTHSGRVSYTVDDVELYCVA